MIRAIAIDDEPYALKVIEEHASRISFVQLCKTFTDPLAGLEYLHKESVPALFLDIRMQDISGTELAKIITPATKIVFTTAYTDYAVQGFELNAVDYLLKPISFTRFLKACHKLENQFAAQQKEEILLIKNGNEIHRIKTSDIYFIEATGNYLKLHTAKGVVLSRQTVKGFIETLNPAVFIRTHKSYIVNLQYISRIETFQLTVDTQRIPLSPNYRAAVWNRLGIR